MNEELKPCPFCGSKNIRILEGENTFPYVKRSNCIASTASELTRVEAVKIVIGEYEMFDYKGFESPIRLVISEMNKKIENDVIEYVTEIGFDINKEELEAALMYDRDQYDKGYANGYSKAINDLLSVLNPCSNCGVDYEDKIYCTTECEKEQEYSVLQIKEAAEKLLKEV